MNRIGRMIYRIDVRMTPPARSAEPGSDPLGQSIRHQIQEFGTAVGAIVTSRIFLIDSGAARAQMERAACELLADPIVESAEIIDESSRDNDHSRIEIHLKPGVMDPVAN